MIKKIPPEGLDILMQMTVLYNSKSTDKCVNTNDGIVRWYLGGFPLPRNERLAWSIRGVMTG
jgi:hypothetical protein